MNDVISRTELTAFEVRMKQYVHKSDLVEHKALIAPMVDEASYLIKKCREDNEDMREIVVRYDEILCTKLDKSKLIILS